MTGSVGTILYMAPEILSNNVQQDETTKTDVYSFGIIMHELFFEELPYRTNEQQFDNIITLGTQVVGGLRPSIPMHLVHDISDSERKYLDLMQECWQTEAKDRPSFEQIYSEFIKFQLK